MDRGGGGVGGAGVGVGGGRGGARPACRKPPAPPGASQAHELGKIQARAHANGATDVVRMTREQACALEPALSCTAALFSPSTGIIDSHALMLAYLGDAEARGAVLALRSRLERALARAGGFELRVAGAEPIECRVLGNSAGVRS